jgi:hypothetical protein
VAGTVQIFDQFYNLQLSINTAQYEVVYSFFRGFVTSDGLASTYAEVLFKVSTLSNIPVETLLEQFKGLDAMRISITMAYLLNSLGGKSFMYGVMNAPAPNDKIQRNIVQ